AHFPKSDHSRSLCSLEKVFHRKLNSTAGCNCTRSVSESGRFEQTSGRSEVCAVDEIEDIHSQIQTMHTDERYILRNCQIQFQHTARAESVPRDCSILSNWRQETRRVSGGETKWLLPVTGDLQSIEIVKTVGEIAVEIHVEDAIYSERLAGLELTGAGNLQPS